ncbi:MAG: hypothetical protein ABI587_00795 [Gemmatimonadales bacterium]
MELRTQVFRLSAIGVPPGTATAEIASLTLPERLRRGGLAPLVGLGIAILVLPIPFVHLAVPPVAILGGLVLGVRRALQRTLFHRIHGTCPACGVEQPLGLNGTPYRLPRDLKCRACLQLLSLDEP